MVKYRNEGIYKPSISVSVERKCYPSIHHIYFLHQNYAHVASSSFYPFRLICLHSSVFLNLFARLWSTVLHIQFLAVWANVFPRSRFRHSSILLTSKIISFSIFQNEPICFWSGCVYVWHRMLILPPFLSTIQPQQTHTLLHCRIHGGIYALIIYK